MIVLLDCENSGRLPASTGSASTSTSSAFDKLGFCFTINWKPQCGMNLQNLTVPNQSLSVPRIPFNGMISDNVLI